MNIPSYWRPSLPGSTLTSIKVGGEIRYVVPINSVEQFQESQQIAHQFGLPLAQMGAGSNLVLADQNTEAVILQPSFKTLRLLDLQEGEPYLATYFKEKAVIKERYKSEKKEGALELAVQSQEKSQASTEWRVVEMGASIPWGQAVQYSLQNQLEGLQWYARIPCQVGGAVYNNIHGEKHFVSESIAAVRAVEISTGKEIIKTVGELDFEYDYSIFHQVPHLITGVFWALPRVSAERTEENRQQYLNWNKNKAEVQPAGPNCGSVFKNLDSSQMRQSGVEVVAAGWYIDEAGLKGYHIGDMQIYPGHANFIVNKDQGTQADFRALVQHIRARVQQKFSILLEPEVECWDSQAKKMVWPNSQSAATS